MFNLEVKLLRYALLWERSEAVHQDTGYQGGFHPSKFIAERSILLRL